MPVFEQVQNLAAVRRKCHRVSPPLEHGHDYALVDGIIFGYQDLEARTVRGAGRVNGCRRFRRHILGRFREPETSREMEATAFARRAFYPDLTAHRLR